MKILHVFNELKFSGAEIMYVSAAKEFQKLNCELIAVATAASIGEYAPYFEKSGYKVLHWPYQKKSLLETRKYVKSVIDYIKQEKIDVIHIHSSGMSFLMSFCAWRAGIKSIYTFHNVFKSNWYSYYYHIFQRWFIKNIFKTKFQTISDSVYNNEKNNYYNSTYKVFNWYNSNKFFTSTDEEKNEIRKKLNIPDNSIVLISIGGCSNIKRHEDIITAMSILEKDIPNLYYLHLGEGCTTNDEVNYAKSCDLDDKINFVKNNDNVREYLIASDIYLMPSKFEGISITTIEALACKVPSILYDVPGLKDFNKEKECSILIEENPAILAKSIIELSANEEKKKIISNNGFELVNKKFDMKRNILQIFNLYK